MLRKAIDFFKRDIWRLRLEDYSRSKSFLLRQLRIFVLAVRSFDEDICNFRASALTFYSLLSIVPVIALMFGIAKGFGLEEKVQTELFNRLQGHEEIAERLVTFANKLLENASGGVIAGLGVLFLFWAVFKVLSHIERSFNDVWGVKTPRSIGRKFSDYIFVVILAPILLILASGTAVIISSQIKNIVQEYDKLSAIAPLILQSLRILPFVTIWVLFLFLFIFMPNTKVKWSSAFWGAIIAGTTFQIFQFVYIHFQIWSTRMNAIYGSFAALPLFLLWLRMSWVVVLFGAELSFAHQNVETYFYEPDCLKASNRFKKLISLLITQRVVKNFCDAEKPWTAEKISRKFEIPIRLIREVLFELVEAGVLSEVKENDKEVAYQPAVDVERITVKYVLELLEKRGSSDIPVVKTEELEKISRCLDNFSEQIEKSDTNILLRNL